MIVFALCKLVDDLCNCSDNFFIGMFPFISDNFFVRNIVYMKNNIFRTDFFGVFYICTIGKKELLTIFCPIIAFPNFSFSKMFFKIGNIVIPKIKPGRIKEKVNADYIIFSINSGSIFAAANNFATIAKAIGNKFVHVGFIFISLEPSIFAYYVYNMFHKKSPKLIILLKLNNKRACFAEIAKTGREQA